MFENTNFIPRILHQKNSLILVFKSLSCLVVLYYLEDLEFGEHFDLSLFETKSESVVGSTDLNPEFFKDLETKKANKSIYDYILKLQTSIVAKNIPEFLESVSATLGLSAITSSSKIPTEPPFIPTILVQSSISDQKSAVLSPPSTPSTRQTLKISSPPSTPHTPHTSAVPTPRTSPRLVVNPPSAMVA